MFADRYGAGVGVGAATVVTPVPEPALLLKLISAHGCPGAMTVLAFTVNTWSPTPLQDAFQLRVTCTGRLAGRFRLRTVAVSAFGDVHPGGSTNVKVVFTSTLPAGPLLCRFAVPDTRNVTPAVVLAGEVTTTPTTLVSVDGTGVGVGDGVGVGSGVGEGVGVGDGLGVGDGVGLGVGDGVGLGVTTSDGVGVEQLPCGLPLPLELEFGHPPLSAEVPVGLVTIVAATRSTITAAANIATFLLIRVPSGALIGPTSTPCRSRRIRCIRREAC